MLQAASGPVKLLLKEVISRVVPVNCEYLLERLELPQESRTGLEHL